MKPSIKPSMKADGNCFETAANIVIGGLPVLPDGSSPAALALLEGMGEDVESLAVVHGMVTRRQDGHRHLHAWVEFLLAGQHPLILDYSNGHEHFTWAAIYYKAGAIDPDEVERYTKQEVMQNIVDSEIWGPWEEKWLSELPSKPIKDSDPYPAMEEKP